MRPAWLEELRIDMGPGEQAGFNPYYVELEHGVGRRARLEGRRVVDLASNDYLGLAGDPRVAAAAREALESDGASLCGTPIATGSNRLHNRLRRTLEEFLGLERALLFPSCYQANMGLFVSLVGKRDVVVVDQFAHASLLQGIAATGCRVMPFLHNDMEHLEKVLERTDGFRRTLVVTESVFSTRGTICPLARILELASGAGALVVVDDSHGIGVLGDTGRGILEHEGIRSFPGIYTASLGKALAGQGGVVAAEADLAEYLAYSNGALIYSTALAPSVAGGVVEVLRILGQEFPALKARMSGNRDALLRAARSTGFETIRGDAPIVSLRGGDPKATLILARELMRRDVFTTPFLPPSVPPGKGVVRMIANAGLNEADLRIVEDALVDAAKAIRA